MKIRILRAVAVLVLVSGVSALSGALSGAMTATAADTATTSAAEARSSVPLPPDWYRQGPFSSQEACRTARQEGADRGDYTSASGCYHYDGGRGWPTGWYFDVYLP
ncbi:hypothetical protein ACFYY8_19355 [Streptosporangium sp. NPDC001559]|uniref:hypothetical protein n=1 Tax=Streptosporangium sp. NPDC001559 TaxID=3366187 RepID=UPI0036F10D69